MDMSQLVAYLQFDGNCKEAMTFYQACLGGELALQTIGDSQMAADMPPASHNRVLHSDLTSKAIRLMASDTMADAVVRGKDVNLCLVCSSSEDINTFFNNLAQDGQVTHPLKEEFFGTFGDLTDKYGFNWMFQYDGK
jgi:PhnB protein